MNTIEVLAAVALMLVGVAALDLTARWLRGRQPTRPPGEGRRTPTVYESDGWGGRSEKEQVHRIAVGSTPVRELEDGQVRPWIG